VLRGSADADRHDKTLARLLPVIGPVTTHRLFSLLTLATFSLLGCNIADTQQRSVSALRQAEVPLSLLREFCSVAAKSRSVETVVMTAYVEDRSAHSKDPDRITSVTDSRNYQFNLMTSERSTTCTRGDDRTFTGLIKVEPMTHTHSPYPTYRLSVSSSQKIQLPATQRITGMRVQLSLENVHIVTSATGSLFDADMNSNEQCDMNVDVTHVTDHEVIVDLTSGFAADPNLSSEEMHILVELNTSALLDEFLKTHTLSAVFYDNKLRPQTVDYSASIANGNPQYATHKQDNPPQVELRKTNLQTLKISMETFDTSGSLIDNDTSFGTFSVWYVPK